MFRDRVRGLRERVERKVKDELEKAKAKANAASEALVTQRRGPTELDKTGPEPPVVARLMVEIRSDGSTTIARGALVDEQSGEKVALEARGTTPLELAGQLAKTMMTLPLTAGQLARARFKAQQAQPDRGQTVVSEPDNDRNASPRGDEDDEH